MDKRTRKKQLGRSMTEMLTVLAVIGVLSIGAVWAVRKAFTVHKANDLIDDVKMSGFVIMEGKFKNLSQEVEPFSTDEFKRKTSNPFLAFKESDTTYAIVATDVDERLCYEVIGRKMDWLEEIRANGTENKCYDSDDNDLSFFFNTALNDTITEARACSTSEECPTEMPNCCSGHCQTSTECTCEEGYRMVNNYAADGSETILGQVCCQNGYRYNSAVGGVCCDALNPYCKEVAYLESTNTQWIDTGIHGGTNDLKINLKFMLLSYSWWGGLFGNYVSEGANTWRIIQQNAETTLMYVYPNVRAANTSTTIEISKNAVHTISYDRNSIVIDGNSRSYSNLANGQYNNSTICLFGEAANRTLSNMRLYYFQIFNGSNLVFDVIPVIDNKGKAGMYDSVSKRIFYNQGSGKFIVGE